MFTFSGRKVKNFITFSSFILDTAMIKINKRLIVSQYILFAIFPGGKKKNIDFL